MGTGQDLRVEIYWPTLEAQGSKKLNLNIKFRESFRPFAPAILANVCNQYWI